MRPNDESIARISMAVYVQHFTIYYIFFYEKSKFAQHMVSSQIIIIVSMFLCCLAIAAMTVSDLDRTTKSSIYFENWKTNEKSNDAGYFRLRNLYIIWNETKPVEKRQDNDCDPANCRHSPKVLYAIFIRVFKVRTNSDSSKYK